MIRKEQKAMYSDTEEHNAGISELLNNTECDTSTTTDTSLPCTSNPPSPSLHTPPLVSPNPHPLLSLSISLRHPAPLELGDGTSSNSRQWPSMNWEQPACVDQGLRPESVKHQVKTNTTEIREVTRN